MQRNLQLNLRRGQKNRSLEKRNTQFPSCKGKPLCFPQTIYLEKQSQHLIAGLRQVPGSACDAQLPANLRTPYSIRSGGRAYTSRHCGYAQQKVQQQKMVQVSVCNICLERCYLTHKHPVGNSAPYIPYVCMTGCVENKGEPLL